MTDRLLQAKEEYDRRQKANPTPTPRMFRDEHEQVQVQQKQLQSTGHKDKQGPCHCGSQTACHAYICGNCGTQKRHQYVLIVERYDNGMMKHIFHRACPNCGAHKWLFMCEARVVKRMP